MLDRETVTPFDELRRVMREVWANGKPPAPMMAKPAYVIDLERVRLAVDRELTARFR